MITKLSECTVLLDKCRLLNSESYYFTTFGAEYSFTIEKNDNNLILKVWNCYDTFKYPPKLIILLENDFSLVQFLNDYPIYYAENVFTGKLVYMDNWINLIHGFKVKIYKETDKHIK